MTEFDRQREEMVKFQLTARGIKNERLLEAFGSVPRELFVPKEYRDLSYVDGPVPIGEGQTISQPYTVAVMTEALKPQSSDRVLEIGTGSGYQAAILSRLVSVVYSVERLPGLAAAAQRVWRQLKIENLELKIGDGTMGWVGEAPFDKIIVTAASPKVPRALFDQLKVEGILVAPVGPSEVQELIRYTKREAGVTEEHLGPYRFVPLIAEGQEE